MTRNFVSVDFVVPTSFEGEHFQLQVLGPDVNELDYEAVMSSKKNLRNIFAKNDRWPCDKMTEKNKCIGCIYIEPCYRENFDAEVYFWIRDDNLYLESEFYRIVNKWIKDDWPFANTIWPGREISWKVWGKRSHSHNK